jgi:hypothetical protein
MISVRMNCGSQEKVFSFGRISLLRNPSLKICKYEWFKNVFD